MILKALEYLAKRLTPPAPTIISGDYESDEYFEYNPGSGTWAVREVPKNVFLRGHKFTTLDSLIRYLKSDLVPDSPVPGPVVPDATPVFVGDKIVCRFNYGSPKPEGVEMDLEFTPEWKTLTETLRGPLTQGTVLKELSENLSACADPQLSKMISNIRVSKAEESDTEIDSFGGTSNESKGWRVVANTGKDGKITELKKEWIFQVPIFKCLPDTIFPVHTVLDIDNRDGNLVFSFLIRDKDRIVEKARESIVATLQEALGDKYEVFEGTL